MAGFLDTSWMYDENTINKFAGPHTIKAIGMIAFILYFILLFTLTGKDDSVLSGKHIALYLIGTIAPLLFFSFFILSSVKDPKYLGFLAGLAIILLFVLLGSYFPSFSNKLFFGLGDYLMSITPLPGLSDDYSFLVLLFFKLLLIFIILIGLSIFYNVFLNEGYRQNGITGFIIYFLFFIPCLISDYTAYLLQELVTTPVVVYFLIGVEILLILMYIFLPRLLRNIHITSGKQLLIVPTYFFGKQTISDSSPFYMKENKEIYSNGYSGFKQNTIQREYSISMWITTNEPTFGRNECAMFTFGKNDEQKGCPYISCTKEGKWKFVVSNAETSDLTKVTTEFVVPTQRWNYVVINYHDSDVDIFINGELLETIYLEGSTLPTYDNTMEVSVGTNTNELHGAICNVTVYPRILSTIQISQSYNFLRLQNPPVYNVM